MAKSSARNALTPANEGAHTPLLANLKALRKTQREASQRVEELKLRLFQLTERHMEQATSIIKNWLKPK